MMFLRGASTFLPVAGYFRFSLLTAPRSKTTSERKAGKSANKQVPTKNVLQIYHTTINKAHTHLPFGPRRTNSGVFHLCKKKKQFVEKRWEICVGETKGKSPRRYNLRVVKRERNKWLQLFCAKVCATVKNVQHHAKVHHICRFRLRKSQNFPLRVHGYGTHSGKSGETPLLVRHGQGTCRWISLR